MIKRFTDISGLWGETVAFRHRSVDPEASDRRLGKLRIAAMSALSALALLTTPMALAEDKRTSPPDLSRLSGTEAEAFYLGTNAIIWGYPSVMFEQLMRGRTSPDIVAKGNPQSAVNQFGLVRDLRGPEFKQIATPNNDTVYAQSFVDVSREPMVLSIPAVPAPRYYTFQLWDPNGDTFGYVGSRTTGRDAGHFALVGPNWAGTLPEGLTRVDSPYDGLVIWGRIGVDGPEDLRNALDIQDQLRLTPLSLFGTSDTQLPPDLAFSEARVAFDPAGIPQDLMLYAELANALRHTPPKPQDVVVATSLTQIGFSQNGTVFDPSVLTDAQRSGLAKGAQFALHLMDVSSQTAGVAVNGWRWSPKSGIMGTDYLFRAAFAKWYTGGNAPSEAIYMDARTDNTGAPLDGSKRYVIRFEPGQEPKVDAFWSISMYHITDGSFVDNPIKRYSIGDRTRGLTRAADGSLTIHIQHEAPEGAEAKANWLPAPAEGFYLNLRLYGPDRGLSDGTWAPPARDARPMTCKQLLGRKRLMSNLVTGILPAVAVALVFALPLSGAAQTADGSVLPVPPVPSASTAGPTLATSVHKRRAEPDHLPADAPNILIILLDDVGFGQADTFGGDIRTPTLTELANQGIAYNAFHTTAICSPTRAALLTGRNQHRVGSGTIAERAVDWDGYIGVIPKTSATIAEVLKDYGYSTAAFGKWHNTPATETTAMGPFDRWPSGYGFEHFYGFLAGETSQWEPRLVENTNTIEPPHDPDYHLTRDLADQAITWLRQHRSFAPDKPFLMYWAPGAAHGPHHIFREDADAYAGKFDDGWDAMRERVFAWQKALGWIPADTTLNSRPEGILPWDAIPQDQRGFQTHLMELFAGFVEDADVQAGRIIAELDSLGQRDNTLVFYIFGDNGASAEGQNGTISELLAQNNIPSTVEQQIKALEGLGGLDVLGSPRTNNMYNAGFAWAGNTPFRYTKLIASDFGGTRNPMVVSWPSKIAHDGVPRPQFHHVNDIAPTIYEVLGITAPQVVNGQPQDPIDGVSLAYTFSDPKALGRKTEQYFENSGSRALYQDGWVAAAFGPLTPWATAGVDYAARESDKDPWALYNVTEDFSEARDLSAEEPERLVAMKERFLEVAEENKVFPVGAGLWLRIHPEDRVATPYTSWVFDETTVRMPEFTAPGLGRQSTLVSINADVPETASGVLYALGGMSGGVTLYMDKGALVYEYNMLILQRTDIRATAPIAEGRHRIEVETIIAKPGAPAEVVLRVDGVEVGRGTVPLTVPAAFTASETFDVGVDLGSPVALAYEERRPFAFQGTVNEITVYLK